MNFEAIRCHRILACYGENSGDSAHAEPHFRLPTTKLCGQVFCFQKQRCKGRTSKRPRASFNDRDSLETTLRNINHSFAEDLTPERFATFVAAVCQDNSDQLELLSAGHGPIFIFRALSGSFEYLDAQALPLGILPEIDRATSVKLEMKTGDMALLITDGFLEWENPREEQFGSNRLAEVVKPHRHEEPETIIAELYDAALKFSEGTRQKDDLTAVLIKRIPPQCLPLSDCQKY